MNNTPALLPRIEIEHPNGTDAQPVKAAVIWMHGLGADGSDFASLLPKLDLRGCPRTRFIFPHAPRIPVSINHGYVIPAWYDITNSDLVQQQDAAGIKKSEGAIGDLVRQEISRGIAPECIVLAGFSQGCAMALHTGLGFDQGLAGIIALSGYLPLAESFATHRHPANTHTPIFMAHGTMDPVVVLARGESSRDVLQHYGYPVQWHTYSMQHSVHPQEIADISAFLRKVLGSVRGG